MGKSLTETERLDWLQLILTQNIGPVTFFNLLSRYGSANEALARLPELSRTSGRKTALTPADRNDAKTMIERAQRRGIRIIAACEPDYPKALRPIPAAPPLLFVRGHSTLFERPAIAIIGARNASSPGLKLARQLAHDLGQGGLVIVSGLARGIDGAAHNASLATGSIAVVAGGVDHVYPPEHEDLMRQLAENGIVMSERPLGAVPTARDFPRRNRLISGLSKGIIIVEAAARSGTLITAKYAAEQGREVFAVPGSPLDPRSHGANGLIRDGAILIESAADVLESLANLRHSIDESDRDNSDGFTDLFAYGDHQSTKDADELEDNAHLREEVRARILTLLSSTPTHRDDLLRDAGYSPGLVADALLTLVLSGMADECDPGFFCRME